MQIQYLSVKRATRFAIVLGLAMLISAFGVTMPAAQGSENLISACKHNRTGAIVIVETGSLCEPEWSPISWNIKGEQGPQGVPGSVGPQGPAGGSYWQLNGSELYYKAGNVGIGTDDPHQNLSVKGGLNVDQAAVNSGLINPGITFGSSSGEGISSKRTEGGNKFGLDFFTQSVSRMSITWRGNVGIGTTNPTSELYVVGKGTFTGGVDPPYISFSNESHESIRQYARNVESHEEVMQFWNGEAYRMEIYVIDEDQFYTITGELIE